MNARVSAGGRPPIALRTLYLSNNNKLLPPFTRQKRLKLSAGGRLCHFSINTCCFLAFVKTTDGVFFFLESTASFITVNTQSIPERTNNSV